MSLGNRIDLNIDLNKLTRWAYLNVHRHWSGLPYGQTLPIYSGCKDGSWFICVRPTDEEATSYYPEVIGAVIKREDLYFSSDLVDELLEYGIQVA